jgi:Tol biopolymer transport system component
MNPDGTGKQRLTSEDSVDTHQVVSPDGRYIIFSSNRAGSFNVWRMEIDGRNPVRLTAGKGEKFPNCSPDSRWVVYMSVGSDDSPYSLWKVPIEGGEPVFLADRAVGAAVSPDGKQIAYSVRTTGDMLSHKIVIIPFAGGRPEQSLDLPPDTPLRYGLQWSADSKSLLFVTVRRGFSNIWSQPLDGSPARQVTDFKFEGGLLFDMSPDGKRFVLCRRQWVHDLSLLTNFR